MAGYAFGGGEIRNKGNYDSPGTPEKRGREILVLGSVAKNRCHDKPFDEANRRVDAEVFPEYVVLLSRDGNKDGDAEKDADCEAKYSEPCGLPPAGRARLP